MGLLNPAPFSGFIPLQAHCFSLLLLTVTIDTVRLTGEQVPDLSLFSQQFNLKNLIPCWSEFTCAC